LQTEKSLESIASVYWWALLGALIILMQAYIFGAWIFSDKFTPTDPGSDPLPFYSYIGIRAFEAMSVLTVSGIVIYFIRTCVQRRPLAPVQLLMLAWLFTFWQDPWQSMFRPVATYNAYLINMGSWSEFIPGWLTPHGSRIPEPLLANLSGYVFQIPLSCLLGAWSMHQMKTRFPAVGGFRLFLTAYATMILFQLGQEILTVRFIHYYAYPGTWGPKLWDGEFYQIPMYEFILFPLVLAGCSTAYFYRDDRGRMLPERSTDRVKGGALKHTVLRILAVTAFTNLLSAGYVWCMAVLSLYCDPWPEMPSWLRNNLCGVGTEYACPAPDIPIQTRYSIPVPPTSGRN